MQNPRITEPLKAYSSSPTPLYLLLLLVAVIGAGKFHHEKARNTNFFLSWSWIYLCGDVQQPGFYKVPKGASIGETLKNASSKGFIPQANPCWLRRPAVVPSHCIFYAGKGDHPDTLQIARLPEQYYYLLGRPVDINRAGVKDLTLLEGIGEVLAKRIHLAREQQGQFDGPENLLSVKGIGMKRLSKLRGRILTGTASSSFQTIICE